jgi:hypothetical protein
VGVPKQDTMVPTLISLMIPYMSNHGWSALVDPFLGVGGSMITVVASSPASTFSQPLSALLLPNVMTITGKGNNPIYIV